MRVESNADAVLAGARRAFSGALNDAAAHAAKQGGAPSDTRAQQLGPFSGRIGSSKPYAKAQERGAFIRPRRGRRGRTGRPPALRLADGRFMKWARIPARRYLAKTGKRWGEFMIQRLRRG